MGSQAWEQALAALAPLRVRAHQLQLQAQKDKDASIKRWEQSEKPVLKEHASGLKETLQLLTREESALEQRVASLVTSTVRNHPGTSSGFNVIRARVDAHGQPLTTDALRAEKDRLMRTIDSLEVDVAAAKAEITQHRRSEETEIWETKLVALQDTKRVYRDEVSLIEVELLGREHYERMQHDRHLAEESGAAQLRRLQESMLQTRIKYNKAKYQYYFPSLKGFNITFGGGGIYGACKDICISELNGGLELCAEPGGVGSDGKWQPARMIVTFSAPGGASADGNLARSPSRKPSVRRTQSAAANSGAANGSSRPSSAPLQPASGPVGNPALLRKSPFESKPSRSENENDPTRPVAAHRSVSFPAAGTRGGHVAPVSGGHAVEGDQRSRADAQSPSLQTTQEPKPDVSEGNHLSVPSSSKQSKERGFAKRFLHRLSNRKDRFQGKELAHLQPARDEDDMMGTVKQKRSLAEKLLARRTSKRGSEASLDRLAFGGHQLADGRRADSEIKSFIDGEDSRIHTRSNGEVSDPEDDNELGVVDENLVEGGDDRDTGSVVQHDEGDGSLASDDEDGSIGSLHEEPVSSPLTKETLRRVEGPDATPPPPQSSRSSSFLAASSSGKGSWLRGNVGEATADTMSVLDDAASSVLELADFESTDDVGGNVPKGVFVMGRLSGFELVGERGTKVPNLLIGRADVRATVYVRFVFEYSKGTGWRPGSRAGDKPMFHVEKLNYTISGNNVPMPPTLIKHILRIAIPGLIQRRLLGLLPREFGDYLLNTKKGFNINADAAVVGPSLQVLDADLGFEVRGPAKSAKEARRQQALYAAAKEARGLLDLSLPQAQILAEVFNGSGAILDPPRTASISELIAFQAQYERHPIVYQQLIQVIDTGYHIVAQAHGRADVSDFSFAEFMAGPVVRMRRKPARTRVVVRDMDLGINADGVVTAIHDFTQRAIEEIIIKGPLIDPCATLQSMKDSVADELEVLHAWHAFALRELQHFKSKFRGAAGTVLAAADCGGFSAGIENCYYEGPLRLRAPVNIKLDSDGAISFELPLPSPQGSLGVFMDNFKSLTVPSHLRPPSQAINWVRLTGDSEVDARMQQQLKHGIALIQEVLDELAAKITANGLEKDDEDPNFALSQPRTTIGDKLGRLIVNRLKVRVRLCERRIGEILAGIDGASMGGTGAFNATAGRIIGHLGDVMTLGFIPAGADAGTPGATAAGAPPSIDRYLLHFESSDISRLRADIQSLGFQSAITPGGAVRLVHSLVRAAMLAFKGLPPQELEAFRDRMKGLYTLLTREQLNISACIDTKGEVENDVFMITLSGAAEEGALRATSPMVVTNELNLVELGMAMRGDVNRQFPRIYK